MGSTRIEWCDFTFNPWWGCVEVSPACDHCYARDFAHRYGTEWGKDARRKFFGEKHWNDPIRWNRAAERDGVRRTVFCASMADLFEQLSLTHPDRDAVNSARQQAFGLMEETESLVWLLLTKRPANILRMVPASWLSRGFPVNVWVGTTVENQEWADRRLPELLQVPARGRFLSVEPLLGPVDLTPHLGRIFYSEPEEPAAPGRGVDWVIGGGESGSHARPTHPDWARSLRDQCVSAGVPFFWKQWGNWYPYTAHGLQEDDPSLPALAQRYAWAGGERAVYLRDKHEAGKVLDGRTWEQFPQW